MDDIERIIDAIARTDVENHPMSDNIAVLLCGHFQGHRHQPKDDPETDNGWGEWVEAQADDTLRRMAEAVLEALEADDE